MARFYLITFCAHRLLVEGTFRRVIYTVIGMDAEARDVRAVILRALHLIL